MSSKEQGEERKRRQRVMGQFRFDQSKDEKNDSSAAEQVDVDVGAVGRPTAFAPKFFCERRQFDRPRKKAGKDGDEIKRQEKQINAQRIRAMAFHRAE